VKKATQMILSAIDGVTNFLHRSKIHLKSLCTVQSEMIYEKDLRRKF